MRVALDTETYPIRTGNVVPELVCVTMATRDGDGNVVSRGFAAHEAGDVIPRLFDNPDIELVFHNAAFDILVLIRAFPQIAPMVAKRLIPLIHIDGRSNIYDTLFHEQLTDLATHGSIGTGTTPDGTGFQISYGLDALALKYLSEDLSEAKDSADSWRVRYDTLAGRPFADYPEEARRYALKDAEVTLRVAEAQMAKPGAHRPLVEFQVGANLSLLTATMRGVELDERFHATLTQIVEDRCDPKHYPLVVQHGIVTPGQPARPYANGAKNPDGTPKMVAATKPKVSQKKLGNLVFEILGDDAPKTPSGGVSTAAEVLQDLRAYPQIDEFLRYKEFQKLHNTELPSIAPGAADDPHRTRVHFPFRTLVRSGRTSSYKTDMFRSFNGQNLSPLTRGCFVARPGHVLVSIDYSSLELCTAAQQCLEIIGSSKMADRINAGEDLHRATADVLVARFPDVAAMEPGKQRKFAKPPNLGIPGGMGAKTLSNYAHAMGVHMPEEIAGPVREVWLDEYPEFREYFRFVEKAFKTHEDAEGRGRFAYRSPRGMFRPNCTFSEACNGSALQTRAAEGNKTALIAVWVQMMLGKLPGCFLVDFIHDELLLEIQETVWQERTAQVQQLMVASMQVLVPDVRITTEATAMRRWAKLDPHPDGLIHENLDTNPSLEDAA